MAGIDAEMSAMQAQNQEYDPAADYSYTPDDGEQPDDEEDYDPAAAFEDDAQNATSPSTKSSPTPESSSDTPLEVNGETNAPLADTSVAPVKQLRTKGGFVDESEDDEDEIPVAKSMASTAVLNASGVAESPKRSITLSPNNIHAPQQSMPFVSAQDQVTSDVSTPVIVPNTASAAVLSNDGTPVPEVSNTNAPEQVSAAFARPSTTPITLMPSSLPKARLPQDKIGMLEDRIAEDPRGDIEAWLSLIEEHRKRHKYEEARADFERFFVAFPSAGEQWVEYVNMETELDNFSKVEQIFGRSITKNLHLPLWSSYINYIRRINNLSTDQTGTARNTLIQVYEFVLDKVGIDVNSGQIWTDYIELIKSGPGTLGGSNWQDMQKMDTVRKVYQRAVAIPTNATMDLWRDYDRFEMGLNKVTGRKHLQEKSAAYVTARAAVNVATGLMQGVDRTTLPKLPPAPGFDGAEEYEKQTHAWKKWIDYEKSDPLEIKEDDTTLYKNRILYLYKNALMALRFWPQMWYDAAEWSYDNDLKTEGDDFLQQGMEANPESCLLAFRQAHQIETHNEFAEGEAGMIKKGEAVTKPYTKVLDALYDLTDRAKKREEQTIARASEAFAAQQAAEEAARAGSRHGSDGDIDDEDQLAAKRQEQRQQALNAQLQGIKKASETEIRTLKKTLSYAWIALMRAMRRVQGKGALKTAITGFRGVFAAARKRGKLLSDAYVASALIEHHCYQDPAASKIFERGMRLFPDDEDFALEYIKFLVKLNDATNARAVFETIVSRLTQKPETVYRAKPLFVYFHDYESQFGETAQITKLEHRMATYFPEDPQLLRFASRYATMTFDPTAIRPIISQRAQMRPAMPANILPVNVIPTIEESSLPVPPAVIPQEMRGVSPAILNSPRPVPLAPAINSPKRPLEDVDNDFNQPRKMMRGESPLKGAAGRRLDAARRSLAAAAGANTPVAATPAPLPRGINFLFSIMPSAHTYTETRFNPEKMVALLRTINLPLPQNGHPAPQPAASTASSAHIGAQLQNIQARYGGVNGAPAWS